MLNIIVKYAKHIENEWGLCLHCTHKKKICTNSAILHNLFLGRLNCFIAEWISRSLIEKRISFSFRLYYNILTILMGFGHLHVAVSFCVADKNCV